MTPELLFAIAWVAGLVGVGLSLSGLWITIWSGKTGFLDRAWKHFVAGGVLLAGAATVPNPLGEIESSGWAVPVVWVWPAGWQLSLGIAVALAVYSMVKVWSLRHQPRFWWAVGIVFWLVAAVASWSWGRGRGSGQIFIGHLDLSAGAILAVLLLAAGSIGAMAAAAKWGVARRWIRVSVLHLALLAGCAVFGVPFLWLVVTSFKETEDLVNERGLVWIPQVRQEAEFRDAENPLYQAEWNRRTVEVAVVQDGVSRGPDTLLVEVERPFNLRGRRFESSLSDLTEISRTGPIVLVRQGDAVYEGVVVRELERAERLVRVLSPEALVGEEIVAMPDEVEYVRSPGLRWQNYSETLEWMPESAQYGLAYLRNSLILVIFGVIGTVLSCSIVAYGFARIRFPGRNIAFGVMLATMMLPGAVTMLPSFLIFRWLGWVDTLYPLWVPAFLASAFNVFLLRQFFKSIPVELEYAAKVDGCSFVRTYWQIMMPQIKPALVVISIWTAIGAWNNFMGPLIYINSPERMPVAYALQLLHSDKGGDFGLLMAGATMATLPVIALFFFAQRYFMEGIQLTGLGGR